MSGPYPRAARAGTTDVRPRDGARRPPNAMAPGISRTGDRPIAAPGDCDDDAARRTAASGRLMTGGLSWAVAASAALYAPDAARRLVRFSRSLASKRPPEGRSPAEPRSSALAERSRPARRRPRCRGSGRESPPRACRTGRRRGLAPAQGHPPPRCREGREAAGRCSARASAAPFVEQTAAGWGPSASSAPKPRTTRKDSFARGEMRRNYEAPSASRESEPAAEPAREAR